MSKAAISGEIKRKLGELLEINPKVDLIHAYLFYVEKKFRLEPVLFPKEKIIFKNAENAVDYLEKQNKLWHRAEIKITFSAGAVNSDTKKIYICPFTGKVFADNTHPNPQDAIYDWVSKCPENTERMGGLRVKRFLISEDPEVISNYAAQQKTRAPISKLVYSSLINGKLFNTREALVKDFISNYLKFITLVEVHNQNRFQIEDDFVLFIEEQLNEEKIAEFLNTLASESEFIPHVNRWLE